MKESEFDQFADEYRQTHAANISASGESPEFFSEYKVVDVVAICADLRSKSSVSILDFGAGIGGSVPYWRKYFPVARVTCLDVSRKSLEVGQSRFGTAVDFVHFDGSHIPFENETFDLVFVACVLHHISHAEHRSILRELHRVLRRGGHAVLFEHNPLNPITVRAVNTCPFDQNAMLVFGGRLRKHAEEAGFGRTELAYRIFFPRVLRRLRPLEARLGWLPLGAQYRIHGHKDA